VQLGDETASRKKRFKRPSIKKSRKKNG